MPANIGHDALLRRRRAGRRQLLRAGLFALIVPAAWLAWRDGRWQEWAADLRTATGEQQATELADGTRLVLNTGSAVNVRFSATERRLTLLSGEILVTTGTDPSAVARPFLVDTPSGSVRALGTRFSLRRTGDGVHAAVFDGAVELHPAGATATTVLRAGEQATFTASIVQPPRPVDATATLWERGMLLARDMRLDALVAELARYHRGIVRCDPQVAALGVSGAFPITDPRASLDMLEKTLPVRITSLGPYWLTVRAR